MASPLKGAKEAVIRNLKNLASACTLPFQGKITRKPKKAQLQIYYANQGFIETASICPVIVTRCQAFPNHRACHDRDR